MVHRLYWLDKEKQIYDETSFKHLELRIFGIRLWHTDIDVDTKHQIMDNKGKTIGFVSNDNKDGEQTGSDNKRSS